MRKQSKFIHKNRVLNKKEIAKWARKSHQRKHQLEPLK